MIETAENLLRDLGFHDVRVRHHELRNADLGLRKENPSAANGAIKFEIRNSKSEISRCLARIEVGPAELPKFLANGVAARVAASLKEIGYAHVTVDLQGYHRPA